MISRFMQSRMAPSPIREAYERAERLKTEYGASEVFDFSIGNPTAPCPQGVAQALSATLESSGPAIHGYMQDCGYLEVRQAVADSLNRRFGSSFGPEHIVMTAGAACALNVLMRAVIDPGDELVVFAPYYAAYRTFADNWGIKLVTVPYDERTMFPNLDAFEAALTPATRMVLVNTPHNPTGLVYPDDVAEGIVDVLKRRKQETGQDILLVSDEPYRELAFDGTKAPWWPALYENTVVVYSWSKSASIAGERIGYAALPPTMEGVDELCHCIRRGIGELGFVNASATAQRMAMACVDQTVDVSYYDVNRKALYEGLLDCGFSPIKGNGAFYLLLPAPDGDEERFLENLAAHRIVAVGGSAFECPGYVRLSYCISNTAIKASLPRFAEVARLYFG
ncbi:Aspartate aminotransferase [Slackia heliotrinireducens]|uniref:Aspartate/tyrosine/aromatic aminotransferase n=2 Tax=Slackia TaxID=84108 RepID=C7N3J2_SLAHD|nr:pyridoxal phosphate-dependent aminotransferase [Slackia heliotrinireducens]ACV23715.1 aspartate/tyrosine/aromatic aminotransferase [Slackia heliotrinireducens DSM 20476]VEH03297.1 Aspartate aminotransferase [Slackia heliotrinireducens]